MTLNFLSPQRTEIDLLPGRSSPHDPTRAIPKSISKLGCKVLCMTNTDGGLDNLLDASG